MKLIFSILIFLSALFSAWAEASIDSRIMKKIDKDGTATIFVGFGGYKSVSDKTRRGITKTERTSGGELRAYALMEEAAHSQAAVLKYIKGEARAESGGYKVSQLWVTNELIVENADAGLVKTLSGMENVVSMRADEIIQGQESGISGAPTEERQENCPSYPVVDMNDPSWADDWNIKMIKAKDVWGETKGKGAVVGIMDSGLHAEHPLLKGKIRGEYGWYDAVNQKEAPYDDHHKSHGTRLGCIVAGGEHKGRSIGVAPEATLIACKASDKGGVAMLSHCMKCHQFMLCPTDPKGENANCSMKPDIVSLSVLDYNPDSTVLYEAMFDEYLENQILPIQAGGNVGRCEGILNQAYMSKAITVGAVTKEKKIWPCSARGPLVGSKRIKPDVSAPGENIISCASGEDFSNDSGAQYAAPHVAGIAALLIAHKQRLPFARLLRILRKSGTPGVSQGRKCGDGYPDTGTPNVFFGYGVPDATIALSMHKEKRKEIQKEDTDNDDCDEN